MKCIFETAQGSVYAFQNGKTIRQKMSGGSQQGEVFPSLSCVFIKGDFKLPLMTHSIRVGYLKDGAFIPIWDINEAPTEAPLGLLILKGDEVVDLIPPKDIVVIPTLGYRPYEWDRHRRHWGNPIVKITAAD